MPTDRLAAAVLAQIMAQALTGWTFLVHLMGWPDVSPLALASLVAAAVVPFRHDGSAHDRAAGNFGAGLLVAGFLWWEIIFGGLDYLNGNGSGFGIQVLFMLVAAVLFIISGAFFWTRREEDEA